MNHYKLWEGFEVIDVIKQVLTPEEFKGFCKGNILKYRLRAGVKEHEPAEKDIRKSRDYQLWLDEVNK